MSGKSLMFNNPKQDIKKSTPVTTAKVGKGANKNQVVKNVPKVEEFQNTGSNIDNIEPVVPEIIEENTAVEVIEDTKIDDEIVNDDVNQDTTIIDDDDIIE